VSLVDQWIDWLLGQLTPAQWDSWRNWMAAIGGLIALSFAVATYRRNVRLKRDEQARFVYAAVDLVERFPAGSGFIHRDVPTYNGTRESLLAVEGDRGLHTVAEPIVRVRVSVQNRSKELISRTVVELDGFAAIGLPRLEIGTCHPEQSKQCDFVLIDQLPDGYPFEPRLIFTDSSGRAWERYGDDPIRSLVGPLRFWIFNTRAKRHSQLVRQHVQRRTLELLHPRRLPAMARDRKSHLRPRAMFLMAWASPTSMTPRDSTPGTSDVR
jgi:hypothetical protein